LIWGDFPLFHVEHIPAISGEIEISRFDTGRNNLTSTLNQAIPNAPAPDPIQLRRQVVHQQQTTITLRSGLGH
jgi:hypothetical protein